MGPFKHEVDDGLDLRKAAFECMYTLLDTCVDRLDIFEFLSHVQDGLKDHYDIKMLTYLMVARVAQVRIARSLDLCKIEVSLSLKSLFLSSSYFKPFYLGDNPLIAALSGRRAD